MPATPELKIVLSAASEKLQAALKDVNRSIASVREAARTNKVDAARDLLDLRSFASIDREIRRVEAAFSRLKRSGELTGAELAQAFTKAQEKIAELKTQQNGVSQAFGKVKESAAALAGSLAVFGLAARQAVSFESSLAEVRKVANTTAGETAALGNELRKLSIEFGRPAESLAALATAGAQTGVAKEQLAEFARIATEVSIAFSMTPEAAGVAVGKLRSIFALGIGEVRAFAGALNALADSANTTEAELVDTLVRAGQAGIEFGLTRTQTAALATTLLNLGVPAEVAATAMRTLLDRLRLATVDSGQAGDALKSLGIDATAFSERLKTNAQGALNDFLNTVAQLSVQDRLSVLTDLFGQGLDTSQITALAANLQTYAQFQRIATQEASAFESALAQVVAIQTGTTQAAMDRLKQSVASLGDSFGRLLLPVIRALSGAFAQAAAAIDRFVQAAPGAAAVVSTIGSLAASAAVLRVAFGSVWLLLAKGAASFGAALRTLIQPISAVRAAMAGLGAGAGLLATLSAGFRALLGPIGLATTAISLAYGAWQSWRKGAQDAESASRKALENIAAAGATAAEQLKKAQDRANDIRLQAQFGGAAEDAKSLESMKAEAVRLAEITRTSKDIEQVKAAHAALQLLGRAMVQTRKNIDALIAQEKPIQPVEKKNKAKTDHIPASVRNDPGEIARVRLEAEERANELGLRLAQDGIKRQQEVLRRSLEARQIDEQTYYAKVAALREQDIAAQIDAERRKLAIARQSLDAAGRIADAGQREREILRAKGDLAEIEQRLILLERDRAEIASETSAAIAQASQRQRDELQGLLDGYDQIGAALRRVQDDAKKAFEGGLTPDQIGLIVRRGSEQVEELRRRADESTNAFKEFGMTMTSAFEEAVTSGRDLIDVVRGLLADIQKIALRKLFTDPIAKLFDGASLSQAGGMFSLFTSGPSKPSPVDTRVTSPGVAQLSESAQAAASQIQTLGQSAGKTGSGLLDLLSSAGAGVSSLLGSLGKLFGSGGGDFLSGIGGLFTKLFGFLGFAEGGYVRGPGTSTSDSIPARLSAGEYVVRAAAVQRFGVAFLDAINGMRVPPAWSAGRLAFAAGGLVPDTQPAQPVAPPSVRIINTVDPNLMHDYLTSSQGERVIINHIQRNAGAIRQLLR